MRRDYQEPKGRISQCVATVEEMIGVDETICGTSLSSQCQDQEYICRTFDQERRSSGDSVCA